MVRERYIMQVRDGQFDEFWEICKKVNEVNRARRRREFAFWAYAGGDSNEVVIPEASSTRAAIQSSLFIPPNTQARTRQPLRHGPSARTSTPSSSS